MTSPSHQPVAALIARWLDRQLSPEQHQWFHETRAKLADDDSDRQLHMLLGLIPRKLGKADLALNRGDIDAAASARSGWQPTDWSVDQAARILVVLTDVAGREHGQPFAKHFAQLCRTADVAELVALYRGLPLYPSPASLETQAGEGLRTNMRAVFEAIAHNNPFPREQFDDNRWNQMVLKALFIGSRLAPIQGLDERANPDLASILADYAHERWAANRAVTPELWRCVGPFASGPVLDDLARALNGSDIAERRAAALALASSTDSKAKALLATVPDLVQSIESGALTWDAVFNNEQ